MTRALLACASALLLAGCSSDAPKQSAAPKKRITDGPMPDLWRARLDTTQGPVVFEINKAWAPNGAAHFWKLIKAGFFDDSRFYRVRPGFIVQFGIAGDPTVHAMMNQRAIHDDPFKEKNVRGTVAFAQAGRNSRRTQVFVNLKDNRDLDAARFVPFGRVVEGLDNLEKLYFGYGEWSPPGRGPEAARMQTQGNAYLDQQFPRLDKLLKLSAVDQ